MAGRIVAHNWNIPAITTSPVLAFEKAEVSLMGESSRKWREVLIAASLYGDRYLARHGIVNANSFFHDEKLNIYLYPRIYQLRGSAFDECYFYAGRCAAEQPYSGVWRSSRTTYERTILVSTSTAYVPGSAYFRMCIHALSGLPWHVILSIGRDIDPATLGPLASNFQVAQLIPQIQILPHVDLFVCLGGPISTAEAMYHGVPLVMITHGFTDPEAYAENAERLGIGVHLRNYETTSESLRRAVLVIFENRELIRRVKEMQRLVRREPGAEETANRIEDYLHS